MAYLNQAAADTELMWKDRKHWAWFPFSFTKYSIQDGRLMIERGFFKTISDETLLYRIMDIKLERTLAQKIFGTGTIHLHTRVDVDCEIHLVNIKNPKKVKTFLSHLIEDVRKKSNVVGKEFYGTDHHHVGPDFRDLNAMGPEPEDSPDDGPDDDDDMGAGMGPEDFQ